MGQDFSMSNGSSGGGSGSGRNTRRQPNNKLHPETIEDFLRTLSNSLLSRYHFDTHYLQQKLDDIIASLTTGPYRHETFQLADYYLNSLFPNVDDDGVTTLQQHDKSNKLMEHIHINNMILTQLMMISFGLSKYFMVVTTTEAGEGEEGRTVDQETIAGLIDEQEEAMICHHPFYTKLLLNACLRLSLSSSSTPSSSSSVSYLFVITTLLKELKTYPLALLALCDHMDGKYQRTLVPNATAYISMSDLSLPIYYYEEVDKLVRLLLENVSYYHHLHYHKKKPPSHYPSYLNIKVMNTMIQTICHLMFQIQTKQSEIIHACQFISDLLCIQSLEASTSQSSSAMAVKRLCTLIQKLISGKPSLGSAFAKSKQLLTSLIQRLRFLPVEEQTAVDDESQMMPSILCCTIWILLRDETMYQEFMSNNKLVTECCQSITSYCLWKDKKSYPDDEKRLNVIPFFLLLSISQQEHLHSHHIKCIQLFFENVSFQDSESWLLENVDQPFLYVRFIMELLKSDVEDVEMCGIVLLLRLRERRTTAGDECNIVLDECQFIYNHPQYMNCLFQKLLINTEFTATVFLPVIGMIFTTMMSKNSIKSLPIIDNKERVCQVLVEALTAHSTKPQIISATVSIITFLATDEGVCSTLHRFDIIDSILKLLEEISKNPSTASHSSISSYGKTGKGKTSHLQEEVIFMLWKLMKGRHYHEMVLDNCPVYASCEGILVPFNNMSQGLNHISDAEMFSKLCSVLQLFLSQGSYDSKELVFFMMCGIAKDKKLSYEILSVLQLIENHYHLLPSQSQCLTNSNPYLYPYTQIILSLMSRVSAVHSNVQDKQDIGVETIDAKHNLSIPLHQHGLIENCMTALWFRSRVYYEVNGMLDVYPNMIHSILFKVLEQYKEFISIVIPTLGTLSRFLLHSTDRNIEFSSENMKLLVDILSKYQDNSEVTRLCAATMINFSNRQEYSIALGNIPEFFPSIEKLLRKTLESLKAVNSQGVMSVATISTILLLLVEMTNDNQENQRKIVQMQEMVNLLIDLTKQYKSNSSVSKVMVGIWMHLASLKENHELLLVLKPSTVKDDCNNEVGGHGLGEKVTEEVRVVPITQPAFITLLFELLETHRWCGDYALTVIGTILHFTDTKPDCYDVEIERCYTLLIDILKKQKKLMDHMPVVEAVTGCIKLCLKRQVWKTRLMTNKDLNEKELFVKMKQQYSDNAMIVEYCTAIVTMMEEELMIKNDISSEN